MQYKAIKKHFERIHPGQKISYKEISISKCLPLTSMWPPELELYHRQFQENPSADLTNPQPGPSGAGQAAPSGNEENSDHGGDDSSGLQEIPGPSPMEMDIDLDESAENNAESQITLLTNQLANQELVNELKIKMELGFENLETKLTTMMEKLSFPAVPSPEPNALDQYKLDKLRRAKSINEILDVGNHFDIHFYTEEDRESGAPDGIYCKLCAKKVGLPGAGVLHYDYSKGESFEHGRKEEKQPVEFRNLKNNAISHLETQQHKTILNDLNLENISNDVHRGRNYIVGMNLARNAYKAITMNQSQASYELEVAVDYAKKGLDVGNKNHGRTFCANLTLSFYAILKERLLQLIDLPLPGTGRPSPISVAADKYTPNRRTTDVIGMNVFLNGKKEAIFVDALPMKSHTGQGIAEDMENTLTSLFGDDRWKIRFVGSSVDGQIVNLNIGRHLDEIVKPGSDSSLAFNAHTWGTGHLIQLGDKDARKGSPGENKVQIGKKWKWIQDRITAISEINKDMGYGKSYEEVLDIAQDNEVTFFRPILFWETRWAAYSERVFRNFLNNYPLIYQHLNEELDPNLDTINTISFVIELSGLRIIYKIVSLISRTVQDPSLFPWHVHNSIIEGTEQLVRFAEVLEGMNSYVTILDRNDSKPNLIEKHVALVEEIKSKQTYQSKPLLGMQHRPMAQTTRGNLSLPDFVNRECVDIVIASHQKLADFSRRLAEKIKNRFENAQPEIAKYAEEVYSVAKILKRDAFDVPSCFDKFIELAKNAGQVSVDASVIELSSDYRDFQSQVYEEFPEQIKFLNNMKSSQRFAQEAKYYQTIFNSPSDFPEILHLAACILMQTNCEEIVESMGSVMKRHAEGRGSLHNDILSKEVFISWNGPPPTKVANTLLEKSLDLHFDGRDNWNFVNKTQRLGKLLYTRESKVVLRLEKERGRINWDCV